MKVRIVNEGSMFSGYEGEAKIHPDRPGYWVIIPGYANDMSMYFARREVEEVTSDDTGVSP